MSRAGQQPCLGAMVRPGVGVPVRGKGPDGPPSSCAASRGRPPADLSPYQPGTRRSPPQAQRRASRSAEAITGAPTRPEQDGSNDVGASFRRRPGGRVVRPFLLPRSARPSRQYAGSVPWWPRRRSASVLPPARRLRHTAGARRLSLAWRAEQGYRWRPMEPRDCGTAVRAAWGPAAPPAFAVARLRSPIRGAGCPTAHRRWRARTRDVTWTARPTVPSGGTVARAMVPFPARARTGRYPAFARTGASADAGRSMPRPWRGALPPGTWLQLPGRSSGDNWYGYRFARIRGRLAGPAPHGAEPG